uniref:Uncharacterized protein n=1 Tax=Brassica oleracea var. oleracea TaxID=109376 RepID=A0A0D3AVX1_BRAOL
MTSRKRSSKKKTSPQSSSGNPCTNEEIVPKEEFDVEQEEKEAYWDALCGSITPPPKVFYPTRPATQLDLTLPSRTSPAYLKTLREFYRVPSGVVFRVPLHGESVEDPPEGLFTCYEAFLTRCRMWFPIPEVIVRALDPNSILPAPPRDLFAKRDLLRNGSFFWDFFTLDRIRNAVVLYRSRGIFRPLRASDMDEPHSDAVPDQRERVRPRKDKGIALKDRNFVSEDLPLPGWNSGFTPGDGSETSEAPLPNDFFANLPPGFTTPASLDEASRREVVAEGSRLINEGIRVFNSTLGGIFREACLSHFKAKDIERKFIRFQNEVAEKERRQAESHSRALIRAERKGRRGITAELARRATLFDVEFRSFKDAQDYVGDFRECRGLVGTLWKSQNADFSFLSEVAEMSGLMDGCAQAESMVPPIEGRIRELWEPIEVSEDTTEAGADAVDEGGEVDQPADSFGASIFGYLNLDL